VGRISSQILKELLDKIDRLVLEAQISEESYYLEDLGKLVNEIEGYLQNGLLDESSAKIILEKVQLISNIIQEKSNKIIKILEDKQKEEKLIQQAQKLLSEIV
jgi:Fe2+ transport system protein B